MAEPPGTTSNKVLGFGVKPTEFSYRPFHDRSGPLHPTHGVATSQTIDPKFLHPARLLLILPLLVIYQSPYPWISSLKKPRLHCVTRVDTCKSRVWIPYHSLVNVQAKVADIAICMGQFGRKVIETRKATTSRRSNRGSEERYPVIIIRAKIQITTGVSMTFLGSSRRSRTLPGASPSGLETGRDYCRSVWEAFAKSGPVGEKNGRMDTAICSPRGGSGDAPADLKEWIQSSGDRGSNPASTRCSSHRARRSVSLQDLSAAADRQREAARRGDDSPSVSGGATSSAVAETGQREAYLVYKVYNRLLKMVANRRRLHNTAMQEAVDTMTAKPLYVLQITNLNLQVSTLKHILASDERVVMSWAAEIQSLKSSLGAAAKQIIQLRKERAELERRLEELDSLGQDLKARLMNEKNERELANDETAALRLQLDKERHKMARIKRDKLALIDKVRSSHPIHEFRAIDRIPTSFLHSIRVADHLEIREQHLRYGTSPLGKLGDLSLQRDNIISCMLFLPNTGTAVESSSQDVSNLFLSPVVWCRPLA
ncbi:hypothetical protein AAG570_003366 [Ranatra chinensis]|uniref:Uncharacterized protein n=1 Tax=Ranatra chinensis TaxID=642074 RepID=A0ABD0YQ69_9HEMI